MKKCGKVLKFVFTLLISIILFISLTIFCVMNSTEGLISKNTIQDVIMELDFHEFLNNEVGNKIYEVLENAGVPKEYVNEMLNQEEVKEYAAVYVSEVVDYAFNPKQIPELNAEDLSTTLQISFDHVVEEANNINSIESINQEYIESVQNQITEERQEEVKNKIEEYTPKIIEVIPKVEEYANKKIEENETLTEGKRMIRELQQLIDTIQKIYSYKIWVFLSVIVCIGFLILLKYKHLEFVKWILVTFMLTTIELFCITYFLPKIVKQVVQKITYLSYQGIEPIMHVVSRSIIENVYLYLLIIGILLCIQFGIFIYRHVRIKQV